MSDITKLPILTSASDGTYLLAVDHGAAMRLPFPGSGQLRGNIGYIGSFGYTGSRGAPSTVPGYVGSKGYTGSTGYIGSSGSSTYRGYVGSQGIQGIPGPSTVLNASTLSIYTTASWAIEYFVGLSAYGSDQTPTISEVNPIIFNTTLGHVGIGTTATHGTLHLKSTTSTAIFLEVTNTTTTHQIFSDPIGNLNIDIDTFDSANGSNFYISQAGARKITIIPNGNVGIVTDQPADTLDVSGILRVSSDNTISKSYGRFHPKDDSNVYLENQRYAALTSTDTNILYAGTRIVGAIDHPETGGVFSFDNSQVGGTEAQLWRQRMTIIENGFVGINVPRPNTLLTVNSNLTTTNVVPYSPATIQMIGADYRPNRFVMNAFGVTTNANVIGAIASGGTATTPTTTNSGTTLLSLAGGGRGDSIYFPELAKIQFISVGNRAISGQVFSNFSNVGAGTAMEFSTSDQASTSTSRRMWISHNGRIITGGGSTSGYSDFNIRQSASVGRAGSLSLTGITEEGSDGSGVSYILMGNANGAGAAGPVVIQSTNRQFQIGTGTNFNTSTGGVWFRNFTIDNNGSGDIYGNWQVCGGVDSTATISTIKTTFNLVNTTATTVNIAGAGNFVNIGNPVGTALIRNQNVLGVNSTQYLWTGTATTIYFASSATEIDIGAATGLMTINNPTVAGINTTQTLFDTTATTMNFARTASFFNAGANTGIATIGNPIVQGTQETQWLWTTTATTVYFASAATELDIGANTGVLTVNNPTVAGINTVQNLFNTTATTMNFAGAATRLNMGSQLDGSIANIANPTVVGSRAEQWLWDTVATTVHAFGAATSLTMGADSGTTTIKNMLRLTYSGSVDSVLQIVGSDTKGGYGYQDFLHVENTGGGVSNPKKFFRLDNVGSFQILDSNYSNVLLQLKDNGDLNVHGSNITSDQTTVNLINTNATTVNAFGVASTINMGANAGTLTIGNPTVVGTQATQNLWNSVATTVNAFGAATSLNLGSNLPGTTTIRNDLVVAGSLTIQGATTYSESANTVISDNMVEIHSMPTGVGTPWAVDDGKDIGLRIHYYNAGDQNAALVMANDTRFLEWYVTGADNGNNFVSGVYGTFKTGNIVLSNLVPGQVAYPGSDKQLTGSSNFFWDFTNNRLGINTNVPAYDLDVTGNIRATGVIYAKTSAMNGMYLQGGDDAAFWDVNIPNTAAIQGIQDPTLGSLKLGSNGGVISGYAGKIGIGKTGSAIAYSLDVNGGINGSKIYCNNLNNGRIPYYSSVDGLKDSSSLTFDGTTLNVAQFKPSNLTGGRVTYYDGTKLSDSANLTFDGTALTAANTINGTISSLANHTTTDLAEGTNLYYTDTRSRNAVSVGLPAASTGSGAISYVPSTGVFTYTPPNLSSFISLTGLSGGTGVTYNNLTGVIGIGQEVAITSNVRFNSIGVGTLTPDGTAGNIRGSGNLTMSGNVTAYSDQRLKINIETVKNALGKTLAMRGVTYNRVDNNASRIGVVAQEVQKVIPEVVIADSEGMLSVDYGNMVGVLIEAIKEQQTTIDQLTADVALLKSKLGL